MSKSKKEIIHDMWEFDFFRMPTNEVMRLAEKQYKLELSYYTKVAFEKKRKQMFGGEDS